jgi:predicted RNA-binding protein with TRAM domain
MTEDSEFDESFAAEAENPEEFEDSETEEEEVVEETQEVEEEETGFHEADETTETEESEEDEEDFDKPVSEGDIVELEVEDLGSKGDGIARKEGFVIFVPGGEVDQTYDVEITSVGRKFAFGEIAE